MKKDYKFNELSKEVCPKCHKPLKQRMVSTKAMRPVCYKCHLAGISPEGKSVTFMAKVRRELGSFIL